MMYLIYNSTVIHITNDGKHILFLINYITSNVFTFIKGNNIPRLLK